MPHYHAAIWIDHTEAKIFSLNRDSANEWSIRPHDQHVHVHHKAGKGDAGHTHDESYFHSVAAAVKDAGEILIAGPGTAKTELKHHFDRHDPQVAKKVVGVETMDHPTDGEFLKLARKFFAHSDKLRPDSPPPPRG
ncbi:MAG TPA: translational machinery protein [Bauldia sp.]|nr:translational machinery protein [Bauldia sp.]